MFTNVATLRYEERVQSDWGDISRRFENDLVLNNRKASTVRQRLGDVSRLVSWHRGDWRNITSSDLAHYLTRPEWLSPQTRRTFQTSVGVFFAWAVTQGLVAHNPALAVPKVSNSKAHQLSVPASREAIRTAIATADARAAMMVKLTYVAGLKPQEIAVIQSSSVFADHHGQYFLRAYRGSAFREVAIPATLADEIRSIPGFHFPGRVQGHVSAPYVSKIISKAMPGNETAEDVRLAHKRASERNVAVDVWRDVAHFHSTANLRLLAVPELTSSTDLQRHLDHISRDIDSDPGAAIDHSKRLLESLFKLVLSHSGHSVTDGQDLPSLYRDVAVQLKLDNDAVPDNKRASDAVRKVMRTMVTTVQSVAELRNALDGHGRHGGTISKPEHARLAFNATVTVSELVATRWAAGRAGGP